MLRLELRQYIFNVLNTAEKRMSPLSFDALFKLMLLYCIVLIADSIAYVGDKIKEK